MFDFKMSIDFSDINIKKHSLSLLKDIEKRMTKKEKDDVIKILIGIAQHNYKLDPKKVKQIKKQIKVESTSCVYTLQNGKWAGTKCLKDKVPDSMFCQQHK